jgi:hypothetical protein
VRTAPHFPPIRTANDGCEWKNALRQPRVSLTVAIGRVQVVVYGNAETTDDEPERAELSADACSAR